jgi:hypothetical protein
LQFLIKQFFHLYFFSSVFGHENPGLDPDSDALEMLDPDQCPDPDVMFPDAQLCLAGIWRSCRHSSEGVCLVRDLCLEYNIWQLQMWSALLHQMTKAKRALSSKILSKLLCQEG